MSPTPASLDLGYSLLSRQAGLGHKRVYLGRVSVHTLIMCMAWSMLTGLKGAFLVALFDTHLNGAARGLVDPALVVVPGDRLFERSVPSFQLVYGHVSSYVHRHLRIR